MKRGQPDYEAMQLLQAQLQDWGRFLEPDQLDLLHRYSELLAAYDEANVIGSKNVRTIILDHLVDSLSCFVSGFELRGHLIDVGAGGGLPGIPLAIAQPKLHVTLLEATEKKVRFLHYAIEDLQLPNVNVLNVRAEDAGRNKALRDEYDVAVARALASLPVVLEYCAPFVKRGGSILAMKGRIEEQELVSGRRAAAALGANLLGVNQVLLRPELEQKQRHIVVFRKTASTPDGYPRRTGLAKKRPLGS